MLDPEITTALEHALESKRKAEAAGQDIEVFARAIDRLLDEANRELVG